MNDYIWRVRVTVLWIIDVVALAAAFVLALYEPGFLDEVLAGRIEGMEINTGVILLAAFFWLVPMIMMYLSLVLGRSILRWLTIILGLLLGLVNLFDFISGISSFELAGSARTIMIGMMVIVPLIIAWHGWKWPESKE